MKRIKVLKSGIVTNQVEALDADADAWFAKESVNGSFGKLDRWLPSLLDTKGVEYVPNENISLAIGFRNAVDGAGKPIKEYHFAADFTVVQEDMTAELAASAAAKAAAAQAVLDQGTRLQAIKAIVSATPGTLTNVQRDAILIHLVKQALGQ